jgi:hypothetical protein
VADTFEKFGELGDFVAWLGKWVRWVFAWTWGSVCTLLLLLSVSGN